MKDQIIDSIGKIDGDMIEGVDTLRQKKRSKAMLLRFSAAAACLCLLIAGAFALFHNTSNRVQSWAEGYAAKDYFKFCDAAANGADDAKSLDISAIPYAETRHFSDRRGELEERGAIPKIDTHPLSTFIARYNDDGSLYCVELTWNRRSTDSLKAYSDLKVCAGYEEIPFIDDCIDVEIDENGHISEPSVTVTERDGVKIAARGKKNTQKSLTFETENGWYQISGSWNDSYESVAELLDWFWEHPIDFSLFPITDGDNYTTSTLAETPDAFREALPDFEAFGFIEESTFVSLKNGTPVHFEGHYVAHADADKVKNQEYYDVEGHTTMHYCVFTEPDVYDLEGVLGDISALTRDKVFDILENEDNKIKFMQDNLLIIIYPDSADEAWALIESLLSK